MRIKLYQIDAFATRVFEGNPAAVCPLEKWLDDSMLQAIAGENNLSETAYFVPQGQAYELRWFSPEAEVDLCGHATLAAAFVIFTMLGHPGPAVTFKTKSGTLSVSREDDLLVMDFPALPPMACTPQAALYLTEGLGRQPLEVLSSLDYIAVYGEEEDVREVSPDFLKLRELGLRGVAVTARGKDVDFVSRFFAPKYGIDEDPVTGSAHSELAPYWSAVLGKTSLTARQLSRRGGEIVCEVRDDRVMLSGRAIKYLEGEITI
jgi:PhzF family phenazine biosynthesis protein